MSIFTGSGVAITTPFNTDGTLNYDAYEKHINFLIENGTDAIVTCGTTGESSTMNDEEHIATIKKAVEIVAGRVPVIAGCGSNDTKHGVYLAKKSEEVGADALLLVTPYYNKCTQNGLIKHYSTYADSTSLPIMLYNVPSRTGVNILPATVKELSKIDNIVAIKEACADIDQISELVRLCGDSIDLYTGNDNQVIPTMSLGGKGVVTVAGNILPREMHDMVMEFINGNTRAALDLQMKMMPIINVLFSEVNPIPIKEAVNLIGFENGPCRPPLYGCEESTIIKLKEEMKKLGLL